MLKETIKVFCPECKQEFTWIIPKDVIGKLPCPRCGNGQPKEIETKKKTTKETGNASSNDENGDN